MDTDDANWIVYVVYIPIGFARQIKLSPPRLRRLHGNDIYQKERTERRKIQSTIPSFKKKKKKKKKGAKKYKKAPHLKMKKIKKKKKKKKKKVKNI